MPLALNIASKVTCDAFHCIAQPNTTFCLRQVTKLCSPWIQSVKEQGCRGIRSNRFIQTVELKGIFALKTVALVILSIALRAAAAYLQAWIGVAEQA